MKMTFRIVLLISCLLSADLSFSQDYSSKNKKAIKFYEDALPYYKLGKLGEAKQLLEKAISSDERFVEAHTMLGYIYAETRQLPKAIGEIKKALDIDPGFNNYGNFYTLGKYQMREGNCKEATVNLGKFLQHPAENQELSRSAEKWIQQCGFITEAMANPVPFKPVNAGPELNSKFDEYFPCTTADEQMFLFTRKFPTKTNISGYQEDFYISTKSAEKWVPAFSIGPQINTDGNEGAPSLSADGKYLFFVVAAEDFDNEKGYDYGLGRQGYGSCDIFYSVKEGNNWSKPRNLGPAVNSYHWETQPSFSSDGKTLYFVRGQVKQHRIHNPDIYMAVIGSNSEFGKAVKLSDVINTPGNEESVFIHPDNQTLYFASDGHMGMGGTDIFMSRRQPNGEWGTPVNLGYPINSTNDENSLLVSRDGKIAYFASNRDGGYGGLDIYSFELHEAVRPGKTIYVKGKVFDAETKLPLEAEIEVVDLQSGSHVMNAISQKSGEFLVCLPLNRNYAFQASKSGYLFRTENFALNENKDYQPFSLEIPLSPIKINEGHVVLNNVFFETAKFNLKDESKYELNKLVDFLNRNSKMKIELNGHTDNVGDKKSNQVLSENRARAVCDYLISNGIAKERLSFKGFGDTKPVVPNDSDEHRQMNRRTEFRVISN